MARLPFYVATERPQPGQPVLASAPSPVLGEMANTFAAFAEKQVALRRQSDVASMTLEATKRLTDLELEFERDTDYRTAPQRFEQQSQQILAEITKGTADRTTLAAFQTEYLKLAMAKGVNVKKSAWAKEKDAAQATLDESIETYARLYADAQNPVEKNLIRQQAEQTIIGSGEAGWITREEAGKRRRAFDSRATEAEIARMGRDPAQAEAIVQRLIAGDFKGLDPVARERQIRTWQARADAHDRKAIAWAERADRIAERNMKKEADAAEKEFMDAALAGTLTIDMVQAKKNVMTSAAYRASIKLANGDDGETDPATYADLTMRLGSEDITADATRAFLAGRLKREQYSELVGKNRAALADTRPGTPYQTTRRDIIETLKPSELNYTPTQKALQQRAIQEFDDWALANPNATREQMQDQAEDIKRRHSQVQVREMYSATPLPRGYALDRDAVTQRPEQALEALKVAAEKLLADIDSGRIPEAQGAREAKDIQVLEEAARRALLQMEADKNKKGRK